MLLSVASLHSIASTDDEYLLGSGDVISIHVYGEDDLSLETRLGEGGEITYPYLGQIMVKGMNVAQLEMILTSGLKGDYLINPSVHVSVLEYRPFFIYGEVKHPGGYPYQTGLTIERAVALAGGLTERASESSITVNRTLNQKKTTVKVAMETMVFPDDSILIKDSFF
ncbi:polysaccharide export protein [Neiella marina]|uniref:Polysaccharide export protein n=2 Tax=Neiella holothuriorum TaxID=2870530 RepID=A0ABS7EGH3_9GAMM|nr:polysaccharide export protein [Neiella holothuriorum]